MRHALVGEDDGPLLGIVRPVRDREPAIGEELILVPLEQIRREPERDLVAQGDVEAVARQAVVLREGHHGVVELAERRGRLRLPRA